MGLLCGVANPVSIAAFGILYVRRIALRFVADLQLLGDASLVGEKRSVAHVAKLGKDAGRRVRRC